jgi:hypothetical protein
MISVSRNLILVGPLGPNQWDLKMPVVVDGNYPETSILYEISIGGVVFDDGALTRTLQPGASPTYHWSDLLHFYKAGSLGSNCFRASIRQGNLRIAHYQ